MSLESSTQHVSRHRSMQTFLCPDCGVGAGARLQHEGVLTELCKRKLQDRRDAIAHGLSVERLAAFVSEGCPPGEYLLQRRDEHTYELLMPDRALHSQTAALADRITSTADHLDVQHVTDRLTVSDSRVADSHETVTDGGLAVDDGRPERPLSPVHPDDDPRTRRAKTEDMDVVLATNTGVYEVHSESGNTYEVDVLEETCSCPDDVERCKHQRRVAMEIESQRVPRPDGRLPN